MTIWFLFYLVAAVLLLGSANGAAHVYRSFVNNQTKTPRCVGDDEISAAPRNPASLRHRPPRF